VKLKNIYNFLAYSKIIIIIIIKRTRTKCEGKKIEGVDAKFKEEKEKKKKKRDCCQHQSRGIYGCPIV
jgi:hypothetical protein